MLGDLASPEKILDSTGVAAFATDENHRIVAWNGAAEDFLGYSRRQIVGKTCHEILCGKDLFGNSYCDESCTLSRLVRRKEPVSSFQLDLRHVSGKFLRATVSVLALASVGSDRCMTVHLLSPTSSSEAGTESRQSFPERASTQKDPPSRSLQARLTPREIEILQLLADGHSSKEIAGRLFIGLTTVRSHSQNILRKLEVHSQLEAVARAYRLGLI